MSVLRKIDLKTFKRITFQRLEPSHFALLLSWLNEPHVKRRWDQDIAWTYELIKEKYTDYTAGYKHAVVNGVSVKKPIDAFMIVYDGVAIGYIQMYNIVDFPLETECDLSELPQKCAAFDWYIGNSDYVRKGIGAKVLEHFLKKKVFKTFDACLVTAESDNIPALRVYEKVGFRVFKIVGNATLMIKDKPLKEAL